MYITVQKIDLKKVNDNGTPKRIEVYISECGGVKSYSYSYSKERQERPIKKAYKVIACKSYREQGKVKKKQKVLGTFNYYDVVDYGVCIEDYNLHIAEIAEEFGVTKECLVEMAHEKIDVISDKIEEEFKMSEEYKVKTENKRIIKEYIKAKDLFEAEFYGYGRFEEVYDVFLNLKNKERLESIKIAKEIGERLKRESYNTNYSSYYKTKSSNYKEEDKLKYKKIYKALASKFHPDIYKDDGEMMKFINRLKNDWGL